MWTASPNSVAQFVFVSLSSRSTDQLARSLSVERSRADLELAAVGLGGGGLAGAVLGDVPLKICNMTCTWVRHTYEGGVWPRFRPALFCLVVDGRVRGTKARTMIGPWKGQAQLPRPDRERRGGVAGKNITQSSAALRAE